VQGAAFLCSFRNGQCSDLVARTRPDVVARIYEASWTVGFLHSTTPSTPNFVARNWATLAQRAGLTVSARPLVGAVVVWQPGVEGADAPTGHVAVVTS
jgi:hypothetical protein